MNDQPHNGPECGTIGAYVAAATVATVLTGEDPAKCPPDTVAAKLEEEAKIAATLNHPGIVTIFDFEEGFGGYFIAMEYIEGETLAERVSRGPLPLEEAISIASQIADGLHGLKQYRRLLALIGHTLLVWGLETGVVGACLLALGLALGNLLAIVSVWPLRDGLDLKRMMSVVVLALVPAIFMAMYNTGLQAFRAVAGGAQLLDVWQTTAFNAMGFSPDSAAVAAAGAAVSAEPCSSCVTGSLASWPHAATSRMMAASGRDFVIVIAALPSELLVRSLY